MKEMLVLVRTATSKNRVFLSSDYLQVVDPSLCKMHSTVAIFHYKLLDILHKVSASQRPLNH